MYKSFKKIPLLAVMVIVLGVSKAQTLKIEGVVKDSASQQSLPYASIIIKGNNNYSGNIITDNNGSYSFSVPTEGLYEIKVNYLGYKPLVFDSVQIDNKHKTFNTYYLAPERNLLTNVTVVSKKPFISFGADKITLNLSQSAIAAGNNTYDIIKRAPGITEQNENLSFRGKSLNILINGRPSNLSGEELKNMLTNMPASTVEKVEILPNPSSKFDAQGGSVINIVLVKNKAYGTNYILNAGFGTGKYVKGNSGLDINFRNKKINLFGSYNYMHNQQYYKNSSVRYLSDGRITSDELDIRNRNNHSYKLGLDYDISKKASTGILLTGFENFRNREVNNDAGVHYFLNHNDSSSNVNTYGDARFNRTSLNAYYKTTFDSIGKELSINGDYMNYTKRWNDAFVNRYYDNIGKEYRLPDYIRDNSPANINVYSFTADYVNPVKNGSWELGIKTSFTTTDNNVVWGNNNGYGWVTDSGKTNHFIYKENVNAAYINYLVTIKTKWELQAGLRAEQTNTTSNSVTLNQITQKHFFDLFPNISIQYSKNDNNIFSISYRKSIRRYDFNYINPFIVYQNRYAYFQGNPYLNPAKTHSLSFNYTHGEKYSLGLDFLYSDKFLAEVYKKGANNVLIQTWDNLSSGISIMPYISLSKEIGIWNSSLYVAGGYVNFISRNQAGIKTSNESWSYLASLENAFTFKRSWTAELTGFYTGPLTYGVYYNAAQFSTDFGVAKQFMKNKASIKLSVSDIFNTLTSKYTTDTPEALLNGNNKTESRFINLSFKYKFGNSNVKSNKNRNSKLGDIQNRIN